MTLAEKVSALVNEPTKTTIHTFNFNGQFAQTVDGDKEFVTTREVSKLLHERAAAVKAALDGTDHVVIPKAALEWLFGERGSFEKPATARGNYWWRSEFRRRAGL